MSIEGRYGLGVARPALSASRAMDVIQFLAAHPEHAFTYSELSGRLEINLASLHAVLHELEQRRFVARDPVTKRYSLGMAVVAIGDAALRRHGSVDVLRREMAALTAEHGYGCVAYVPVRADMVCVATSRSEPDRIQVGQRVPLLAPFGTVFLAWAPPPEVTAWLARSGLSAELRSRSLADLDLVRARGWSATVDGPPHRDIERLVVGLGEHPRAPELWRSLRHAIASVPRSEVRGRRTQRIRDVTAPVFDADGKPTIALTMQGFDRVLSSEEVEGYATALGRATAAVTAATGGVNPSRPDPADA
jgi:DNA-binding IclR family transcriptional regulator